MTVILETCTELRFFEHMRVTRSCFNFILQKIEHGLNIRINRMHTGGRPKIGARKMLAIGLWYLANQDSYRQIGETFGVTKSTAHKAAKGVIDELNNLKSTVIQWPSGQNLMLEEEYFASLSSIRGTIGSIDGCHIKIEAPSKTVQQDYVNRKHYHSINLLAVCDSKKKFTYISVGSPGSFHDQRVLYRTELWDKIDSTEDCRIFPSGFYHIVGDSAFKLMEKLMVPYRDNSRLTIQQKQFNTKLSMQRGLIENAYALLKGRFRRLKCVRAKLGKIPYIISACAVLHNISLDFPQLENFMEFLDEPVPVAVAPDADLAVDLTPSTRGKQKRDRLAGVTV